MTDNKKEHDFPRKVPQPAVRAPALIGITRLEQLAAVSENELMKLYGMGPRVLGVLKSALIESGLSFAGKSK